MLQQSDLSRVADLLSADLPTPSPIRMPFEHTLARSAKVWRSQGGTGPGRNILVVITTLVLDKNDKAFKADAVTKLARAALSWIAETDDADDFVLVHRPKDWD